jgi:hypothetical protein
VAPVNALVRVLGIAQSHATPAEPLPILRVVARVLIAALIAVLVTYIVIEQIGSWRRRRSGRA